MKALARKLLRRCGYELVRQVTTVEHIHALPDLTADEREICRAVAPFTLTSIERIVALIHAVQYLATNAIDGDWVECGVWRGGSTMAAALAFQRADEGSRDLHLYDTFEGMPAPTARDVRFDDVPASRDYGSPTGTRTGSFDGDASDVLRNLQSTGYDMNRVHLIKGRVEETIPLNLPDRISLLRLDTDWYESTKHTLAHAYPRLVSGGVLIVDDYGHWRGAREAVDEYFAGARPRPFLHRIDYTGRLVIKP